MKIKFDKKYLTELWQEGKCSDKKHRYQPQVVNGYVKCITYLSAATNIEYLYNVNSLNYEVLKGDKKDISSVRITKQYRLEFEVSNIEGEDTITICTIMDISNHYR